MGHVVLMDRTTLGAGVYQTLKDWIVRGRLRPGDRLIYTELSQEFGVSHTPLKEAFLRLEKEGLVLIIPRRGTFVRRLSSEEINEFYQIREVLEGLSARLACGRANQEDVEELRAIDEQLEAGVSEADPQKCLEADVRFHEKIVAMSANTHLIEMVHTHVLTNLFAVTDRGAVYLEKANLALENHRELIRAIEAGHCEEAEKVMRRQIQQGASWILTSIRNSSPVH